MVALSGLFFSIDALPTGWRVFANMLPTTHAVALMQGVWDGAGWGAHWVNVLGLVAVFAVCSAVSTKVGIPLTLLTPICSGERCGESSGWRSGLSPDVGGIR